MTTYLRLSWTMALIATLIWGCADDDVDHSADGGASGKDSGAADQQASSPDAAKPTALKVAAVQYGGGDYTTVKGCTDDICGLSHYVRQAAKQKVEVVVTPEYSQLQKTAELSPKMGEKPGAAARFAKGSAVKAFASLADELNITLVFNLITQEGSGSAAKLYNAAIAVNRDGKVIARHYKFQLFGSESKQLTAGATLQHSFFDTSAGKVGLMICADAQCVVTNLSVTVDCPSRSVGLLKQYFAKKPRIVLFPSFWTVGSSNPTWWSLKIQQKLAKDGQVWLVVANTTKGSGRGGGIYKPSGDIVKQVDSAKPSILYADIPLR